MKARAWSSILGTGVCLLVACSASKTGTGVNGGDGATSSTGSTTSTGAQPILGGSLGTGAGFTVGGDLNSTGGMGGGCQTGGAEFVPKVPTVMLVVDRSGTMFKDAGNPWNTLRDGVLEVVQKMNNDVRFGFLAVTGEQAAGMCPLLDELAPADHNYDALAAKYMSLVAPTKGESPGMRGLQRAAEILAGDTTPGDKYILFVTDGEQDYCNDGDFACPTDSVVYHLQQIAAKGVKTFVFGLPMKSDDTQQQARYPAVLQAFADAGMGVAVAPVLPPGGTAPLNIYYNCQGVPDWAAEVTAAGVPAMSPLGNYAAASGGAKVFTPDATNK
ncbi:MAG: vWA domain-containing protein, partial [Myxococcales bacterium]